MDKVSPQDRPSWLEQLPQKVASAGTVLSYFYLLRVPILMALALIGLPVLAVTPTTAPLVGNLFLLHPANVLYAMIAALMLSQSVLVVSRVVLLNGARFNVPQALTEDKLTWGSVLATFALVTPMLYGTVAGPTLDDAWPARLVAGLFGLLIAYLAGCGALVLAVLFAPQYKPTDDRFPALLPRMKPLLARAYERRILPERTVKKLGEWGLKIPLDLRIGYLDEKGAVFPGQWFSGLMLAFSFVLFWLIGFWKQNNLGDVHFPVPAIGYVLILLLVINWILSMAAFFLDRFRVPLLLPLAILFTVGNWALQSDHYYSVQRGVAIQSINPADVLTTPSRIRRDPVKHPRGRVVVVATAGGGIQAAAWTARVLTGLQEQIPEFADSVAALSAVSGGAVGTMFFVNQYRFGYEVHGFPERPPDLVSQIETQIVQDAESPSLDDIAWALVYNDFFRIFLPYVKHSTEDKIVDRGWALEETWRNRGNIHANLSNWRNGVLEGWRPAVIFNATVAETGQALLFSTSDFSPGPDGQSRTFSDLYHDTDLPVVTAVRLAATFPYVTPAARAVSGQPEYHIVDGGYYDNYGVFALLNWLDEALEKAGKDNKEPPPDILFIQIRSFPKDAVPDATTKGWFYQTYAPLDALFNVRTNQQRVRDQYELLRFRQRWSRLGVKISNATFEFAGSHAPLSWAMNEDQISAIQKQWKERLEGKANAPKEHVGDWREVRCFFQPKGPDCEDRPEKDPW